MAAAAAAPAAPVLPKVPPPPPINYKGTPFYSQTTPVPYTFVDTLGADNKIDVPTITLPPGTLLFRAIRIPKIASGDDPRRFFTEFLGNPEGNTMCLPPYHNTFFYPFPYIAFGTHDIGSSFDAVQIYCTTRPLNVISAVSPSPWYRGITKTPELNKQGSPYQRCSNFEKWCHEPTYEEKEALRYDNCIDPTFAQKSGVRGWMALADLDSLKPYKLRDGSARNSPMGKYLLSLQSRIPGILDEMMTHLYIDSRKHTGYPEIALYPLKTHQGDDVIKRNASTEREVQLTLQNLVAKNELNFLPIATITKDGIADNVNGFYVLHQVPGVNAYNGTKRTAPKEFFFPERNSHEEEQKSIEKHLYSWMESMKSDGITLPRYGHGVLSFDMRTGFYVLPQMVPKDLRVRGETDADAPTYNSLLIRLNTPELRQRATEYSVLFRTFLPHMYMKKFPLAKGFGVPRAMVLSRPGFFKRWFEELDIKSIPKVLDDLGKRASYQFEENTGRRKAKKLAAEALYAPAQEGPKTPPAAEEAVAAAGSTTPPYYGSTTPPYAGSTTPPYYGEPMNAAAPPSAAAAPPLPPPAKANANAAAKSNNFINFGNNEKHLGGSKTRTNRGKKQQKEKQKEKEKRKTRRRASNRQTHPLSSYSKIFSSVWKNI